MKQDLFKKIQQIRFTGSRAVLNAPLLKYIHKPVQWDVKKHPGQHDH